MRLYQRIAEKVMEQKVQMKTTNFQRLDLLELEKRREHSQVAPAVRLPQRSGQSPALRSDSFPEKQARPAHALRGSCPVRTIRPLVASSWRSLWRVSPRGPGQATQLR